MSLKRTEYGLTYLERVMRVVEQFPALTAAYEAEIAAGNTKFAPKSPITAESVQWPVRRARLHEKRDALTALQEVILTTATDYRNDDQFQGDLATAIDQSGIVADVRRQMAQDFDQHVPGWTTIKLLAEVFGLRDHVLSNARLQAGAPPTRRTLTLAESEKLDRMIKSEAGTPEEIAKTFGVSRHTVYNRRKKIFGQH